MTQIRNAIYIFDINKIHALKEPKGETHFFLALQYCAAALSVK